MRFCKKLGRQASLFPKGPKDLKMPEKPGEVTKETEAAPSEVRLIKRRKAVPAQGVVGRVSSQYQRLLCLSQSRCLGLVNWRTRVGPTRRDQSLVCRGKSPWRDDRQHAFMYILVMVWKGAKNDVLHQCTERSGWVLIWWSWLHKSLGLSPEQAFQLCSPQTGVTSGRNAWCYGAWSQSCRFASHHLMQNIFKRKIRRGSHFHLVMF